MPFIAPLKLSRLAVASFFFCNGAIMASWVSRIPALQHKLGLSTGQLGIAYFGIAVGAMIGMPIAGALSARFGSRPVCVAGFLAMCLILPVIALATGLPQLTAALVILGMGEGSADVAMNTQAVSVQRLYGRPIMPSFHALWSVGGFLGAGAGGLCAGRDIAPIWHWVFASIVLGCMGLIVANWLIPADEDEHTMTSTENGPAKAGSAFVLPNRRVVGLGVIAFCSMLGEGGMSNWSAVYLHRNLYSTQALAADGYALFALTMSLGRFSGDALTHKLGSVKLVRIGGLLAAFGMGLAVISGSVAATLIGFAFVGAGFSLLVPLAFSAAGNLPDSLPGPTIASVSTVGYSGFLVGPPVIGFAAEAIHLRGALGLIILTSLLVAALALNVAPAENVDSGGVME